VRLKIKYASEQKGLLLPVHYNDVLQALLYRTFSNEIAKFLHNEGFSLGKRHFKLFTFSRILNKGNKVYGERLSNLKRRLKINNSFFFKPRRNATNEEALYFKEGVSFYFSSPKDFIIEDMGNRAVSIPQSILLNQDIFVTSIEVIPTQKFSNRISIKMLSPVTVYSTIRTRDKKALTYYYSPYEKEFSTLIQKNAEKKYTLINGTKSNETLKITPLYFNEKRNRAVVYFKNTRIEGWTGVFTLEGGTNLIKTVYEAGLGSKNPEGFGMWAPFKNTKF